MTVTTIALTGYALMWPALVGAMAVVLARGFYKDWKEAKDVGETLV